LIDAQIFLTSIPFRKIFQFEHWLALICLAPRVKLLGPSIYDVHTEGERSGSDGSLRMGEGVSTMWTSTHKFRTHWHHHPAFFSYKEVFVVLDQNFVFGRNKKCKLFVNIN